MTKDHNKQKTAKEITLGGLLNQHQKDIQRRGSAQTNSKEAHSSHQRIDTSGDHFGSHSQPRLATEQGGKHQLRRRGASVEHLKEDFAFKIDGVPHTGTVWRSSRAEGNSVTALMVRRWADQTAVLFNGEDGGDLWTLFRHPQGEQLFADYVSTALAEVASLTPPPKRPRPGRPGWTPQAPVREVH